MVNHKHSLAFDGSLIPYADLFDSDSDDCNIGNIGTFEDMTFEELDSLIDDPPSQPSIEPHHDSLNPSSQNAPPNSSSSPGDTDPQFTPASSGYDLPSDESNLDENAIDFVAEYTNSPNEPFEQISPYSSRSDDYSHMSQSMPRSTYGSSQSATRSRESTSGVVSDQTQQQWPSFSTFASDDTLASNTTDQLAISQYHDFNNAATMSVGATASDNLFGTTLPFRPVHYSQPWTPVGLQSSTYGPSWGSFHEQSIPFQNEPHAQFMSQYMQGVPRQNPPQPQSHYSGSFAPVSTSSYDLTNHSSQQMQQRHAHHNEQQLHSHHNEQRHEPSTQASIIRQAHSEAANLSTSTRYRYRYPHQPAITAERQSPTSSRQKPRQIAVANVDDIPITARPRDPQTNKPKQGGRKRNTHLNQDARERSSRMRKKGACWRCKLQRDPVSRHELQIQNKVLTVSVSRRRHTLRQMHHRITERSTVFLRL